MSWVHQVTVDRSDILRPGVQESGDNQGTSRGCSIPICGRKPHVGLLPPLANDRHRSGENTRREDLCEGLPAYRDPCPKKQGEGRRNC
jgi:hypothetical protein